MQNLEEDGELARMLAEQDAFLASNETPAAKVVRRQEEGSDNGKCGRKAELHRLDLKAGEVVLMGCAERLDQTRRLFRGLTSPPHPPHHHAGATAAAAPSAPQQQPQQAPVAAEPALPTLIGSVVEKTGQGMIRRRKGGRGRMKGRRGRVLFSLSAARASVHKSFISL